MEQDMREKVVEGFEKLREYADREVHPVISPDNWCVYSRLRDLIDETEEDALMLLKAQVEEIKALRQLVEWAEECGFGLDNILWHEYVTEEELDSIDGYVEQMIYVARKAVNGNA